METYKLTEEHMILREMAYKQNSKIDITKVVEIVFLTYYYFLIGYFMAMSIKRLYGTNGRMINE
jgi:hypothetical protein